jgi:hypothetical protein
MGTAQRRKKQKHEKLSPIYPVCFVTHLSAGQRGVGLNYQIEAQLF